MSFHYNVKEACEAQDKYVNEIKAPHFAPFDGVCWSCGRNIYWENGYSVEEASKRLITGCPFCSRSYCD